MRVTKCFPREIRKIVFELSLIPPHISSSGFRFLADLIQRLWGSLLDRLALLFVICLSSTLNDPVNDSDSNIAIFLVIWKN